MSSHQNENTRLAPDSLPIQSYLSHNTRKYTQERLAKNGELYELSELSYYLLCSKKNSLRLTVLIELKLRKSPTYCVSDKEEKALKENQKKDDFPYRKPSSLEKNYCITGLRAALTSFSAFIGGYPTLVWGSRHPPPKALQTPTMELSLLQRAVA